MARIVIVDDEPAMAEWISNLCRDRGHQAFHYVTSKAAVDALPHVAPQLVLANLTTDSAGAFDILAECRENHPDTVVVMIAAFDTVELALKAIQLGAFDYISKPFKVDELVACIQRAVDHQAALHHALKPSNGDRYKFENLI